MLTNSGDDTDSHKVHVLEIMGNAIVGGMETYVKNLIARLPADQFCMTCLCPFESALTMALRQMGCDVFITPVQDDPAWRSIQLAVELVHHQGIDLIHAHMPKAHALAGLAGALTHTPVVATVHGMNVTTQELGIYRTTGSHLIAVCQEAYGQALAMGVSPQDVTLIPNGVDLETFSLGRSGEEFRRKTGIPLDSPLVGFLGRIELEKGPDQFVRAAEVVLAQRPDVYFALVGEGSREGEIAGMIRRMGLDEHVRMAGMWTNTWDVYPAFDVLAQTSRSEGMPLSLLEGMASGLAAVAIGVGGVPEVVEVGTTGFLVGPGDWEGLGRMLVRMLDKPEQLKQMGQAARRRVENGFNLRTSAQLTANLFHRLANPGLRVAQPLVLTTPNQAPSAEVLRREDKKQR